MFLVSLHNLITTMSTKVPVSKCLSNIENALLNHDLYQQTHGDVMNLPIVVQCTDTIEKLQKEVKIMKKKEKKSSIEIVRNKNIIKSLIHIINNNNIEIKSNQSSEKIKKDKIR